jgi:hypothetical protein
MVVKWVVERPCDDGGRGNGAGLMICKCNTATVGAGTGPVLGENRVGFG